MGAFTAGEKSPIRDPRTHSLPLVPSVKDTVSEVSTVSTDETVKVSESNKLIVDGHATKPWGGAWPWLLEYVGSYQASIGCSTSFAARKPTYYHRTGLPQDGVITALGLSCEIRPSVSRLVGI